MTLAFFLIIKLSMSGMCIVSATLPRDMRPVDLDPKMTAAGRQNVSQPYLMSHILFVGRQTWGWMDG